MKHQKVGHRVTPAVVVAALSLAFFGCATADWKEQIARSSYDRDRAFRAASEALARVGNVSTSDPTSGSVNGECRSKLDAAIVVFEQGGQTKLAVKSKYNLAASEYGFDMGDREKCINRIIEELRRSGVVTVE
jgi:hypothetical protein